MDDPTLIATRIPPDFLIPLGGSRKESGKESGLPLDFQTWEEFGTPSRLRGPDSLPGPTFQLCLAPSEGSQGQDLLARVVGWGRPGNGLGRKGQVGSGQARQGWGGCAPSDAKGGRVTPKLHGRGPG